MRLLPRQQARRRRLLGQIIGVAGGGLLAGLLYLITGTALLGWILVVPCLLILLLAVRSFRQ